ncbi:MAG TPA: transcriptional regulator [Trueperaceae bacterium]|nr:transcriptional regulator [Trueperaceae bacterium]
MSKNTNLDQDKNKILNRLKRLEGQIRGLQKMVEEDRTCSDQLTLLSGIRSALDATADVILEDYLHACKDEISDSSREFSDVIKAIKLARG